MKINGRRHPWVFRTWSRARPCDNYVVSIGYQLYRHAWGIELHWGRRDLMGETVLHGETRFADSFVWSIPVHWR